MTLEQITQRCSGFSGFNLQAIVSRGQIEFVDPNDNSTGHQSRLVLGTERPGGRLYEIYGRMHHWGMSLEEKLILKKIIDETLVE